MSDYSEWKKQHIRNERLHKLENLFLNYYPYNVNSGLLIVKDESVQLANTLAKKKFKNNSMRNKKCLCGSGKKFKFCCWDKYQLIHTFKRVK